MLATPAIASAAPQRAPITMRVPNGTGVVRLGVAGSLSFTSSAIARSVMITTVTVDPRNARCESWRFIQPRCAAQQATAGAVIARKPAITPIAKARHIISEEVMARNYHEKGGKLKEGWWKTKDGGRAEKKRGPGLGSRAPRVAFAF